MKPKSLASAGRSVTAAEIICKLDHGPHSFVSLLRSIRCPSEAILAAALAELVGDGYAEHVGTKFMLKPRGKALVAACRPGRRNRDRRTLAA